MVEGVAVAADSREARNAKPVLGGVTGKTGHRGL